MLTKLTGVVFGFLFIFCTSAAQADEAVSLKIGYLQLSPSGDLAIEEGGIGTRLDVESDLDLDDSDGIVAEAALAFGNFKASIGYLPLSFEGNSTLTRTIIFNGRTFLPNSPIQSSLDIDILDLGLTWFFINMDDTPTRFQLGAELAVKVTDADTSFTDLRTGINESASETLPIPTLGLRGRVAFSDYAGVSGRVGYLGYNDNRFLDADVQVDFSPIPLLGLFVGYRFIDLEIDESDVFVDTQLDGFYGGAFLRF